MQQMADCTIEIAGVGAVKHHLQVVAVVPPSLATELCFDDVVKACSRQGVGDTDADLVRLRGLEQLPGRENVREALTQVAQLNEKSDAYACALQQIARRNDLLDT